MALEITEANFEAEVLNSDKPILIDFWASWCGPCLAIAPMIEELAKEMEGVAKDGKVDVDSNPGIAATYGVRGIPALMVFKGGKVVDQFVGAGVAKNKLAATLSEHAGAAA